MKTRIGITRQNQTDRARWGGELAESEQTAPELTRSRQMWSAVDVADSNVFVLNCRWKIQVLHNGPAKKSLRQGNAS